MGAPSGALQLRLLQTVSEVAADQNSTLVMPLPMEMLRFFEQTTGLAGGAQASTPSLPTSAPADLQPDPPVTAASPGLERTDGNGAGR